MGLVVLVYLQLTELYTAPLARNAEGRRLAWLRWRLQNLPPAGQNPPGLDSDLRFDERDRLPSDRDPNLSIEL